MRFAFVVLFAYSPARSCRRVRCVQYRECGSFGPFLDAGKPMLDIEYSRSRAEFCPKAAQLGFFAMRKRLELDAWRRPC